MAKPGVKQLLVEVPVVLNEALDHYCASHDKLKGAVVRRAVEAYINVGTPEHFALELDADTAEKLAIFREARDGASIDGVVTNALLVYFETVMQADPLTRSRYDAIENKRRAAKAEQERSKHNLVSIDGNRGR